MKISWKLLFSPQKEKCGEKEWMGWHERNWMSVGGAADSQFVSESEHLFVFKPCLVWPTAAYFKGYILKSSICNIPISTLYLLKWNLYKSWMEKWIKVWYELPFHPPRVVLTCGVSALAAGREQKHGNVIGIFQIVQKFSKKAKYIWNRLWHTNISRDSFFEDVSLI